MDIIRDIKRFARETVPAERNEGSEHLAESSAVRVNKIQMPGGKSSPDERGDDIRYGILIPRA